MSEAETSLMLQFDGGVSSAVESALAGHPWQLADAHAKLLRKLWSMHKGHQQPMSLGDVKQLTGLSDRGVKAAIETLRSDFNVPVGSVREGSSAGYFVCMTEEDRRIGASAMIKQAIAMLRGARAIVGSPATILELMGQEGFDSLTAKQGDRN